MILKIVELAPNAPEEIKQIFANVIPGSIMVSITRGHDHMIRHPNGCWVYFEGGFYTRPATRKPTQEERIEYAKIAAGRAKDRYPTVAKAYVPDEECLVAVGYVDTDKWEVTLAPNG